MVKNDKINKLSKKQIKLIKSLHTKKNRYKNNLFLVEGEKSCRELIEFAEDLIQFFIVPDNIDESYNDLITRIIKRNIQIYYINHKIFPSLTDTKTPQQIFAVASMKPQKFVFKSPLLILDNIQDPGNLGTIIRSMDWFGLNQLILSSNCVDIFNSKVIRATMGSIFRINYYIPNELRNFIISKLKDFEIIGASTNATISLENYHFPKNFAIVFGNEARGISDEINEILTKQIKISGHGKAESLNASVACSIFLYEISKNIQN